jgi:hypothetical protein
MTDQRKRYTVFDPIDDPNTKEESTGAGTLVDNDLPGGGEEVVLTAEQIKEKTLREQAINDAYAKKWERLLSSDKEEA